jgi:hypothetical protein
MITKRRKQNSYTDVNLRVARYEQQRRSDLSNFGCEEKQAHRKKILGTVF